MHFPNALWNKAILHSENVYKKLFAFQLVIFFRNGTCGLLVTSKASKAVITMVARPNRVSEMDCDHLIDHMAAFH